jgi:hypothetical protein
MRRYFMSIVIVKTGDETLRVREEEFGCTVWSKDKYAEGNKSTFDVLKRLSENPSIEEVAEDLSQEHGIDLRQVYEDLLSMFQELSKAGWFLEELSKVEEKL